MTAELSTSLADTINEAHHRASAAIQHSKEAILAQVNAQREVGIYLRELKDQTRHGDWVGLFATAFGRANIAPLLYFDYSTGRRYMKTADRYPEPVTELAQVIQAMKDGWISAGELPESSRGDQESHGLNGWLTNVTRFLSKADTELNKQLEKAAMEEWEIPDVENFVEQSNTVANANAIGREVLRKAGRDQ